MNFLEIAYRVYADTIGRIASELVVNIAARIDDVRTKYKDKLSDEDINFLAKADISGNHKYLSWMCQRATQEDPEVVANAVEIFHNNISKLSKRDINAYPDTGSIYAAIRQIAQKGLSSIKVARGSRMIYPKLDELSRFAVFTVPDHKAMRHYGAGTRWCVAQQNKKYWDSYSQDGVFFVLYDLLNSDKWAVYVKSSKRPEVWEPADFEIGHAYLEDIAGPEYRPLFDAVVSESGKSSAAWESLKSTKDEYRQKSYEDSKRDILTSFKPEEIVLALPRKHLESMFFDEEVMENDKTRKHILSSLNTPFLDANFEKLTPDDIRHTINKLPVRRLLNLYTLRDSTINQSAISRLPSNKRAEYIMRTIDLSPESDDRNHRQDLRGLLLAADDVGFNFATLPKSYISRVLGYLSLCNKTTRAQMLLQLDPEEQSVFTAMVKINSSKPYDLSILDTSQGREIFKAAYTSPSVSHRWKPKEVVKIMDSYNMVEEPYIRSKLYSAPVSVLDFPAYIQKRFNEIIDQLVDLTDEDCGYIIKTSGHTLGRFQKMMRSISSRKSPIFDEYKDYPVKSIVEMNPNDLKLLSEEFPVLKETAAYLQRFCEEAKNIDEVIEFLDSTAYKFKLNSVLNVLNDTPINDQVWKLILHWCRTGFINRNTENTWFVPLLNGIPRNIRAEAEEYAKTIPFMHKELEKLAASYDECVEYIENLMMSGDPIYSYQVERCLQLNDDEKVNLLKRFPAFSGPPDWGRERILKSIENISFEQLEPLVNFECHVGPGRLFDLAKSDSQILKYKDHQIESTREAVVKKLKPENLIEMVDDPSLEVRKEVAKRAPLSVIVKYLRDKSIVIRRIAQKRLGANPDTGELF